MNLPMLLGRGDLGWFFAVACIRAAVPAAPGHKLRFSNLLRFPGRIERLRRSRWQWFSMVALLLVVRLQAGLPLVLEAIVAVEFLIFLALPTRGENRRGSAKESKCGHCGKSLTSFAPCEGKCGSANSLALLCGSCVWNCAKTQRSATDLAAARHLGRQPAPGNARPQRIAAGIG